MYVQRSPPVRRSPRFQTEDIQTSKLSANKSTVQSGDQIAATLDMPTKQSNTPPSTAIDIMPSYSAPTSAPPPSVPTNVPMPSAPSSAPSYSAPQIDFFAAAHQVSELATFNKNAHVSVGPSIATSVLVDETNISAPPNAANVNATASAELSAAASANSNDAASANSNVAASADGNSISFASNNAAAFADRNVNSSASTAVYSSALSNVSAAGSGSMNVTSCNVAAPSINVNAPNDFPPVCTPAYSDSQINILLAMQRQISSLESQLRQAEFKIAENKRERTPSTSFHPPLATSLYRPNPDMQQQYRVTPAAQATIPGNILYTSSIGSFVTSSGASGLHRQHVGQPVSTSAHFAPNRQPAIVNTTASLNGHRASACERALFNEQSAIYVTATPHNCLMDPNGTLPPTMDLPRSVSLYTPPTVSSTATSCYGHPAWSPINALNEQPVIACAPVVTSAQNLAASSSNHALPVNYMPPPRKLLDLPSFSGQPEDWPIFFAAFTESTSVYKYTNFENNQRLNKCLRGEARDVVKSLLIHPSNVNSIIEQLRFRFGRPEQLIRSQLKAVREVPPISETSIEKLVSFATTAKNLTVFLQSIGEDKHLANPILLEELVAKLPLNKRFDWARHSASILPFPTIAHFSDWLSEVASFMQMVHTSETKESKRRAVLHTTGELRSVKCVMCQGDHKINDCRRLLDSTVAERWKLVKQLRLCFSCLWPGHSTRDCRRRKVCSVKGCSKFHNRILHESEVGQPPKSNEKAEASVSNNPVLNCSARTDVKLLFRVIAVTLYGPNKRVNTYALLDEGSSITMMDDSLVKELGLSSQQREIDIQWFGGKSISEPVSVVNLFVSGLGMKKRHMLRNVHGVANLSLPMQSLSQRDICNAVNYQDKMPVQPYENVTPKLLIGLDHCHLGLPVEPSSINDNGPYAAFTDLGCVIFGPSSTAPSSKPSCLHARVSDSQVHNMIKAYFDVESFGVRAAPPHESADDTRAKDILEKTTVKLNGRFQTGLLWKHDKIELPESYSMALRRLVGIERRMTKDNEFGKAYQSIIEMYVEKKYARKLLASEASKTTARTWYLPHFGVVNPQKPGKLRLVFDAAATSHGVSLNSQLLKGPQEYRPLVSVLFHLREGRVAVCADIQEMFHQVLIRPEDRCSQRFLWRNGDNQRTPDVYEMSAMTFGAACSPCSANYVKVRNALEHKNYDQRAVKAITDYHYVDDYVDSFDSISEAISISQQVRDIHKGASFQLRKFRSNVPEVVAALDGETTALPITSKESMASEKILGMMWLPQVDTFTYRVKFHGNGESVISGNVVPTKRSLLSIVMSFFDPLGLVSHFTVTAKLMMREIWKRDLGWDEPVPPDILVMWTQFQKQIPNISDCQISRHYFNKGKPESLQLHIFVDASEDAFAAVSYWRSETSSGEVDVSIVFAKTRSSPLKSLSIPRLELQAAVLGSRMMSTIVGDHTVRVDKCVFWSDSSTVLKWIASEHCRYKPFVAHRVAEILSVTKPSDWRWVPTKENVADEATRVNKNVNLGPSSRWYMGPAFLRQAENTWPTYSTNDSCIEDQEELRPKYALLANQHFIINFERFSAYTKLKRVVAWVLRFIKNSKPATSQASSTLRYGLTATELIAAEQLLCRQIQNEAFAEEVNQLQKGLVVSASSPLYSLTPLIDEHGILRLSGRLSKASWLSYDMKHPIILPPKHPVTKLIIVYEHSRMKHLNTEATICMIRQKFWIPNLRKALRGVITRCNVCKLKSAKPNVPQMGQLPEDRVTPYERPFTYTGLDYFGPVSVAIGRRTEKRWVALLTCLTTRAIHLEIAHDLSTDACILALRNFMNRRGVPKRIRSDNGTNFIGVNGELTRFRDVFDCVQLQNELSTRSVEWLFNCPENPSAGGAWERMVQCVKKVLQHTMKDINPKEHTFQSLLIEAENVVNSRPLTHLPVDPEQEEPLTPNHFLLGSANTAQTPSCMEPPERYCSLRKQWRIARQMRDRFWKRWVEEYLPTLTRRSKWCSPTTPLQEGDLVLICDPNEPRKEWRRGRIQRVYPGQDGQVRRADVLTSTGAVQRPASKLAKLDIDGGESTRFTGVGMS